RALLFDAAGAGPLGEASLAALTAARLLRVVGCGAEGVERVAVYDDAVRAVVAARLGPAEMRRINLDLGHMMARGPSSDAASVAECFERAGVPELGVAHLRAAAEQASVSREHDHALAF